MIKEYLLKSQRENIENIAAVTEEITHLEAVLTEKEEQIGQSGEKPESDLTDLFSPRKVETIVENRSFGEMLREIERLKDQLSVLQEQKNVLERKQEDYKKALKEVTEDENENSPAASIQNSSLGPESSVISDNTEQTELEEKEYRETYSKKSVEKSQGDEGRERISTESGAENRYDEDSYLKSSVSKTENRDDENTERNSKGITAENRSEEKGIQNSSESGAENRYDEDSYLKSSVSNTENQDDENREKNSKGTAAENRSEEDGKQNSTESGAEYRYDEVKKQNTKESGAETQDEEGREQNTKDSAEENPNVPQQTEYGMNAKDKEDTIELLKDIFRKTEISLALVNGNRNRCKSELKEIKQLIRDFAREKKW